MKQVKVNTLDLSKVMYQVKAEISTMDLEFGYFYVEVDAEMPFVDRPAAAVMCAESAALSAGKAFSLVRVEQVIRVLA